MYMKKILILLSQPKKIFPTFVKKYGRQLSYLFKNQSFYLQGQMDIHPFSIWRKKDFIDETHGFFPLENTTARTIQNLEPWDTTRRDMLILILRTIITHNVPGSFVEIGVYKGLTAKLFHYYAPERTLHLFDTFSGFEERSSKTEKQKTGLNIEASQFSDTSIEEVRDYISPLNNNIHFYKGYFPESMPQKLKEDKYALVHLDADLYEPTWEGLQMFYEKMSKGGIIVIHDYNSWPGARQAVDTFFKDKDEIPLPMPDKSGSVVIIKQ